MSCCLIQNEDRAKRAEGFTPLPARRWLMSLLGTVPGQIFLWTGTSLGMRECCLRRCSKRFLKIKWSAQKPGSFWICVLSLFSLPSPKYITRGGEDWKVPWGSSKCPSGGERGDEKSLIAHVVAPSPCSNYHTGESEIQKTWHCNPAQRTQFRILLNAFEWPEIIRFCLTSKCGFEATAGLQVGICG